MVTLPRRASFRSDAREHRPREHAFPWPFNRAPAKMCLMAMLSKSFPLLAVDTPITEACRRLAVPTIRDPPVATLGTLSL